MRENSEGWEKCFQAAHRKVAISRYHRDRLEEIIKQSEPPEELSSIPVQAYFEGVVVSVMAAVDQVAQGVNFAIGLGAKPSKLFEMAFKEIIRLLPKVRMWYENPLGIDLRRIRTRIIHYSYKKSPAESQWFVESAGMQYKGNRELVAYSIAAVNYLEFLEKLLPELEAKLKEK
jgi:hypothetical protein